MALATGIILDMIAVFSENAVAANCWIDIPLGDTLILSNQCEMALSSPPLISQQAA